MLLLQLLLELLVGILGHILKLLKGLLARAAIHQAGVVVEIEEVRSDKRSGREDAHNCLQRTRRNLNNSQRNASHPRYARYNLQRGDRVLHPIGDQPLRILPVAHFGSQTTHRIIARAGDKAKVGTVGHRHIATCIAHNTRHVTPGGADLAIVLTNGK